MNYDAILQRAAKNTSIKSETKNNRALDKEKKFVLDTKLLSSLEKYKATNLKKPLPYPKLRHEIKSQINGKIPNKIIKATLEKNVKQKVVVTQKSKNVPHLNKINQTQNTSIKINKPTTINSHKPTTINSHKPISIKNPTFKLSRENIIKVPNKKIQDDFIEDNVDDNIDYSRYIKEIFGYDKTRYRDIEIDDVMETSFRDQMKEEARSAKIGLIEDLEDIQLEKQMIAKKQRLKSAK